MATFSRSAVLDWSGDVVRLASSHAACFGIGLPSVLAQRGGSADRLHVTATIVAEKGKGAIRVTRAHVEAAVEGLTGVAAEELEDRCPDCRGSLHDLDDPAGHGADHGRCACRSAPRRGCGAFAGPGATGCLRLAGVAADWDPGHRIVVQRQA